ncbi:MAG: N-acetylmuramoyl-L-alanine amidase [Neisseriaceae bacterium]|nr:N-acetylmuramoyl-L-alanine amidase [Neisseriaceae bacterium]
MNIKRLLYFPAVLFINFTFAQPIIVLDAGHTPEAAGALGAKGIYEVEYNDRFVAELKPQLEAIGYKVILTRNPEQNISLQQRARIANQLNADLFLSIHHDSTREKYLVQTTVDNLPAQRTIEPFRGFSAYVSNKNGSPFSSYCFAENLTKQILPLGRAPALYHTDPIKGENRPLLNKEYGIYRYDNLVVLRSTQVPAVLLEIGVIPDEEDEAWVSNSQNRHNMQQAIVRAVANYQDNCIKPYSID